MEGMNDRPQPKRGSEMNVAQLSLCKELYAISEWDTTTWQFAKKSEDSKIELRLREHGRGWPKGYYTAWPAYDLGYLLRKLPTKIGDHHLHLKAHVNEEYKAKKTGRVTGGKIWWSCLIENTIAEADTPEDAACKLAIELFKQGILKSAEGSTGTSV